MLVWVEYFWIFSSNSVWRSCKLSSSFNFGLKKLWIRCRSSSCLYLIDSSYSSFYRKDFIFFDISKILIWMVIQIANSLKAILKVLISSGLNSGSQMYFSLTYLIWSSDNSWTSKLRRTWNNLFGSETNFSLKTAQAS